MIGRWVTHVIIYLAVCSTMSLFWVLMGDGTVEDLKAYAQTPADALTREFWPIWVWLVWGTFVVAHAGVVVGQLMRPSRWQRAIPSAARRPRTRPRHRRRDPARVAARSHRRSEQPAEPRRRFVAAMFTDISDSTGLTASLGDVAWVDIIAVHRRVVRGATTEFNGTEVATQGDGFFVRFDHPARAVQCAIEIERRLEQERGADARIPPVRIGIHVGDAIQATDDDVLGHVVNVAARLLDVADSGEILVTESVADHVDHGQLLDRGLVELKGLGQPRHVLGVKWS